MEKTDVIAKIVKVVKYVFIIKEKIFVKSVVVKRYVKVHGVQQQKIKSMMVIVFFVLFIFFQINLILKTIKQKNIGQTV
jgi:hypothetical protein